MSVINSKRRGQKLYYAMEDADLTFTRGEVQATVELYNMGNDEFTIGKWLDRDPDEIHVLLLDQGRKGKINPLRVVYPTEITDNTIAWYLQNSGWSMEEIGVELWGRG